MRLTATSRRVLDSMAVSRNDRPEMIQERRGTFLRWAMVVVWMTAIFVVSSMPSSLLPSGAPGLGHLIEYSVLGGLLANALLPTMSWRRAVALAVLIASLYGIVDELHQYFTPGRNLEALDWVIDTLSAFAGALITAGVARTRRRKSK